MLKLIRIGEAYFRLDKGDDGLAALIEVTFGEGESPPEDVIDGDEIRAGFVELDYPDLVEAHKAAHVGFTDAKAARAKSGKQADLDLQHLAAVTFVMTKEHYDTVTLAEAEADLGDIGSVDDIVVPNTYPADGDGKDGKDDKGGDDTKPAGDAEPVEDPTADPDPDGGDPTGEDGDGDGGILQILESLTDEQRDLVTAALQLNAGLAQPNVAAAGDRSPPMFINQQTFTREALAAGAAVGKGRDGNDVIEVAERTPAKLVAAAGATEMKAGAVIEDDTQLLHVLQDWEEAHRAPSMVASPATTLAYYNQFETDEVALLDRDAPTAFQAVRANAPSIVAPHKPTIHADGSTCDNCVRDHDVRRQIPDIGIGIPDLASLFQVFPSDHCDLKYYKGLSLSAIDAGVTTWDENRAAAFCAARDAYYAALRAGTPVDPQLYVDMRQLEKDCAIPSCVETDQVQPEGLSVCLRYTLEMQQCMPEIIPIYRNALMRWYQLRKNMRIMQMMDRYNIPLVVNAGAAPFVNVNNDPLGASIVVMEVIQQLLAASQMAELTDSGNYMLLMQFGFDRYLTSDELKRAEGQVRAFSEYVGIPTTVVYNETPVAPVPAPVGSSYPGPAGTLAEQQAAVGGTWSFGPGSLPPTIQGGANTGTGTTGAAPDAPLWSATPSLRWPQEWSVRLVDINDFFMVTRPTVRLGAQATPDVDDALGNMRFDLFLEEFFGIGKDGLHPSFKVTFQNLCNNGARVAGISPQGLC